MSTFVGKKAETPKPAQPKPAVERKPVAVAPVVEQPAQVEQKAEKTRAELVEEAESLGIKVPPKANKGQIQKLIDEAPVM